MGRTRPGVFFGKCFAVASRGYYNKTVSLTKLFDLNSTKDTD